MKKLKKYGTPALFGLLIYASIRVVNDTMSRDQFWHRPWRQNLIEIVVSLAMSYTFDAVLQFFIRRFNKRQWKVQWKEVAKEFAEVCLACLILVNPIVFLIHYWTNDPIDVADVAIANIIVLLYVLLYYAIVRGNQLIRHHIQQQTQLERIKSSQLETELKYLKAQYHPHFLFNALNTIYFQMDESIPEAKKSIEEFSALLRYQLYDPQQLVTITKELEHLQRYIHLQKARASAKLHLEQQTDPALNGEKIYPLLLMPLVENAFKYVGGQYQLSIATHKEEEWLYFEVKNSLPEHLPANKNGGIGLENLKRRLALLYPDAHELKLEKTSQWYTALLKIKYVV